MDLIYISLIGLGLLSIINIFALFRLRRSPDATDTSLIRVAIAPLEHLVRDTNTSLKNEFVVNRKEHSDNFKDVREEMGTQLHLFTKTFTDQIRDLTKTNEEKLEIIRKFTDEKLGHFQTAIETSGKLNRSELKDNLEIFKKDLNDAVKDFRNNIRDNFSDFSKSQDLQNKSNTDKVIELKKAMESAIRSLQDGNEKKLEEMRKTVDEKLNDTLEKRLGESFKLVSERLEAVHRGLGDMQNLASSVGDLKKVMTNVKTRGVLGEYQLQNLLDDLLTSDQYEKNVRTKEGSGAVVEFAIKMPHGKDLEKTLWLPIDAKFPKEDYEALINAYESGDATNIEQCRKSFMKSIQKCAQDIKDKYIDPPNTTEYGVMFLPYESLYAEVLRIPGLFERLQRELKITIAGPTTLSAFLNSLQMGFRTLAIEKRTSEVWDLLSAVKTEFGQFGVVLQKTKTKLEQATKVIDNAGVRSRAIERKLRDVQELPWERANEILQPLNDIDLREEAEAEEV